jgi:hypothetical protein
MTTISLCTFVGDEPKALDFMLNNTVNLVDEVVLVYTNPSVKAFANFKEFFSNRFFAQSKSIPFRFYHIGFTSFGNIRTLTAHLASMEWVLMLDADETTDIQYKETLLGLILAYPLVQAFGFPRKRWADLEGHVQIEVEAYPDWQVRLFKNKKEFSFKRELHEYFDGAAVHNLNTKSIHINHFHDVFKTPEQLLARKELYQNLAGTAGVTVEGGHVTCTILE